MTCCVGSFKCDTLDGWSLSVSYMVEAYVKEDLDLYDVDSIVVSQPTPSEYTSSLHKRCKTFEVKQFLGLSKGQVKLECR